MAETLSPPRAEQIVGLWHGQPDSEALIHGSHSTLRKLQNALNAGLKMAREKAPSASKAFQKTLKAFQTAQQFPDDNTIVWLLNANNVTQLNHSFDNTKDYAMPLQESVSGLLDPPIVASREIDAARAYLEVGCRVNGHESRFEIMVVTCIAVQWQAEPQWQAEILPPLSGMPISHTVPLLRLFIPNEQSEMIETWVPFVSEGGIPPSHLPDYMFEDPAARPDLLAPVQPQPPTAQTTGARNAGEEEDEESREVGEQEDGDENPLAGVTNSIEIQNALILRAGMRYTNAEIIELCKTIGPPVKKNTVTKRITNALNKGFAATAGIPNVHDGPSYRQQRSLAHENRQANRGTVAEEQDEEEVDTEDEGSGNDAAEGAQADAETDTHDDQPLRYSTDATHNQAPPPVDDEDIADAEFPHEFVFEGGNSDVSEFGNDGVD